VVIFAKQHQESKKNVRRN